MIPALEEFKITSIPTLMVSRFFENWCTVAILLSSHFSINYDITCGYFQYFCKSSKVVF